MLHALPKVDLHRHLEGSLRLETLAEIAQEHGIDLPSYDLEQLRPYVQFTDEEPGFHRFLEKFKLLRRFYTTREAVKRVAYEAVVDAATDNVKYLELRFSPSALAHAQNFPLHEVTEWVIEAVEQAQAETGVMARLLCAVVRHDSIDLARQVIEVAIAYRDRGIVGVDLTGDEVHYPAAPFAPLFRRVADYGLGITIHAGEAGGAENVREAVEVLHAQRIGHGIRSIEDSKVVQLLRQQGVALEICPTSNLQTGVVDNFGLHPLRDLYVLGVNVTINTDDPSISDTSLTDEYMVAMMGLGVTLRDLRMCTRNSIRAAFLPPEAKQHLERLILGEFDAWL
ncbi:MAG: adenosine deaminase [Chloroflexi bacterium]|nr:adenosine deaminase [Chloroflexota bacterium]